MRRSDLDWLWTNRPLLISQIIAIPLVVTWLLYFYFHDHATFALVIVFLIPVFAVANVVIISRSRKRLSAPSARSDQLTGEFLTPVVVPHLASSRRWTGAADMPGALGRMNASAPLAVLEMLEGSLTLRVRPSFLAAMFVQKDWS
jgi:hypothetical protein